MAQLLHGAGLFLGYELLEANPSNPYGHFEDVEVVEFHRKLLLDNGESWQVDRTILPVVGEERWRELAKIVDRRNAEHALWGFKDPRVCMFLALWEYLLPDAKVLIVYRHFSEAVRSLHTRHAGDYFSGKGAAAQHLRFFREPDHALRMWLSHNRALLLFAEANPDSTLVVSSRALQEGFPLIRALNEKFALDLAERSISEVYDASVTDRTQAPQLIFDRTLIPEVDRVWSGLERLAEEEQRAVARDLW